MKLSEYLKPALGVAFVAALAVGYYLFEHRQRPEEKDTPGQALVIVTKSTNACFSDMVRVTGFIVPRREAQVGVDQEGSRVTDLFVKEGDMVTENQELARLTAPPQSHAALFCVRSEEQKDLVAERAHVDGLDRHLLERPGERKVFLENAPHPVDFRAGDVQTFTG